MAKTDTRRSSIRIGVFGFDGCSAWVTSGLLELFAVANLVIDARGRSRSIRFEHEVVATKARSVRASHGVRLMAHPQRPHYDALIVPPIWAQSRDDLVRKATALRRHNALLTTLASRSTIVAGACTGVTLLAQAGLLSKRRVTTCWWLVPWFAERFSDIRLAADRLVVRDGDRWTAAAGSAYLHLGLAIVHEYAGDEIAAGTARLLLVEKRRGSQSPFAAADRSPLLRHGPAMERVVRALNDCVADARPMHVVAKALGTTTRTLTRRLRAATGMSPLEYLQTQRIARAKTLLAEQLPFEAIVEQCGYRDVASFRKLFTRHVGITPGVYRSQML